MTFHNLNTNAVLTQNIKKAIHSRFNEHNALLTIEILETRSNETTSINETNLCPTQICESEILV